MRELERTTRVSATAFVERACQTGLTRTSACELLGVDPRTLATWQRRPQDDLQPRGRPPVTGSLVARSELVALVLAVGPRVATSTIHQQFAADISRRETAALVAHLRAGLDDALAGALAVLEWRRAGAVWAVDFKTPPTPVDGLYPAILVVRDLASGMLLLARPVPEATAEAVAGELEALVLEHGAPLVLKADNGSNLVCDDAQAPMRAAQVALLRSPPGTPSYNGACEAGIGSLTTRAAHEAARHGRPGRWTCDDVEAARRQANELARHADLGRRTAAQAWGSRRRVGAEEREVFLADVARHREGIRRHMVEVGEDVTASRTANAIERIAIKNALVERELLSIRGRAECLLN
jgi:hypothetical protein